MAKQKESIYIWCDEGALKIGAVCFLDQLIRPYQTTQCHKRKDHNINRKEMSLLAIKKHPSVSQWFLVTPQSYTHVVSPNGAGKECSDQWWSTDHLLQSNGYSIGTYTQ